jgi:dolichyl-diphosphooligosaccharide--protein glycosyltransferase
MDIGRTASDTYKNSLMYKLSYYRFSELRSHPNPRAPLGYDRVRKDEVGVKDIELTYFREVYTTERWLVRIYEVVDPVNREFKMKTTSDPMQAESKFNKSTKLGRL